MQSKQSTKKIQQFIKFWEEETLSINKDFQHSEQSNIITRYMKLLNVSLIYFKEAKSKDLKKQLLDCICISYENIGEVYKQESQKLKEIEINIFLFHFISKNAFEKDEVYNFNVIQHLTRSYSNFIYSIKDIDKKFTDKITKELLKKAKVIEKQYLNIRNIHEGV